MRLFLLVIAASAPPAPKDVLLRFQRGDGTIKIKEVDFRGVKFTDVTGRMKIDGMKWRFDAIRGECYGGVLTGHATIDRGKEGRPLELSLSVGGAELHLLTEGLVGHGFKGRVSGEVEISYKGTATTHLAGRGSAVITGAELGRFPVVLKLLSLLRLAVLKPDVMEVAEFHFVLTPRGVVFQFAEVRSGDGAIALRARRNGCLRYDGGLDFVIEPRIERRLLKRIPGLGDIFQEVFSLFDRSLRVRVSGSLKEPKVSWAPLR